MSVTQLATVRSNGTSANSAKCVIPKNANVDDFLCHHEIKEFDESTSKS